MANQQLIQGARDAANKFTDVTAAVDKAMARGEQALLRRRAIERQRQELQAQAIAQLPQLDTSKVPMQMRGYATTEAAKIRETALAAIQNKDLTPVERQLAIQEAISKVNEVATKSNDYKQWIANFAEIAEDDLSQLNDPILLNRVNDIYKGNFTVNEEGNFEFSDGSIKDFSQLVNTRPIMKRSDSYLNSLKVADQEFENYGIKGFSLENAQNKIKQELESNKYTDADLASILLDELGAQEDVQPLIKQIKEDFEADGDIDDPDLKKLMIDKITTRYTDAATEAFNRGKNLYDKKIKDATEVKSKITPYQYFQMKKYEQEQALKNNQYLQRSVSAIQRLATLDANNITDAGKLQAITGLLPLQYDEKEGKEAGLPGAGIALGEKYFISADMDVNDVRRILAQAMAESGIIEQSDIEDILMSIRPSGMKEERDIPPIQPGQEFSINTDFSNPLGTVTSTINN